MSEAGGSSLASRISVPETVIAELQRLFRGRGLSVGDRLPTEADLAELLGVSRSSIREAVQAMRTMGLIEVRHGVGMFLAESSGIRLLEPLKWNARSPSDLFFDLIEARLTVEVTLARLAAEHANATDIERIRLALRERAGADASVHVVCGVFFHLAIAKAAKNEVLAFMIGAAGQLYREILELLDRNSTAPLAEFIARQQVGHDAIFAAIEARNPSAAGAEMEAHLLESKAFYAAQMWPREAASAREAR